MSINETSGAVVDAAVKIHRTLGPGLLEAVYEGCLIYELRKRGHRVENQLPLPVVYDETCIDLGYRLDLLVNGMVIVEVKAVARLLPIHCAQVLTYLRLSGHRAGLLLNFNVPVLKHGIRRFVNRI